jgi:hypothetical protein
LSLVLRIIGLLCLGGAGVAGSLWLNTDKIMNPVRKEVVISTGKITTLMFTPNREISSRDYDGRLYFDNTPGPLLNCDNVKLLGIQWAIGTSEIAKSWNDLKITNDSCEFRNHLTVVSFLAPSFKPDTNYYVHLSKTNKIQQGDKIKVYAAIQHVDGIGTHYLFMDKALFELLGGLLLLVSFICFLIDFLMFFFRRRSPKMINEDV